MEEDLRLLTGGRGEEEEIPAHITSPTIVINEAWACVKEVAQNALEAYLYYCKNHSYPHSYLLGLDILITGKIDPNNKNKVIDIRPTILEGPCCNSYPACPGFFSKRLYLQLKASGYPVDKVNYPVNPNLILDKLVDAFQFLWEKEGKAGKPVIGVFTRPYSESEEETAHLEVIKAFKRRGFETLRITPEEKPYVKEGRIWVGTIPVDMCYRRIERIHVPVFYGEKLAKSIIEDTPNTYWINPWKIDDLRSKTIEERAFREWERWSGKTISRPVTLLPEEITTDKIKEMLSEGGYVHKLWNSTGGKGVFLHVYLPSVENIYSQLYRRFDGRHMILITEESLPNYLKEIENLSVDATVQQLRTIDARKLSEEKRLVYDTRINVLFNARKGEWEFISGISRCVPCGENIENGNSLLTNVSSGAELAPLVMGESKEEVKEFTFGPLLSALMEGKKEVYF